jgi:hypothetical protein
MTPMEPINTDETMNEDDDDMRAEYDFSNAVRGNHAAAYAKGFSVRVLDDNGNVLEKESRDAEEEIERIMARKQME